VIDPSNAIPSAHRPRQSRSGQPRMSLRKCDVCKREDVTTKLDGMDTCSYRPLFIMSPAMEAAAGQPTVSDDMFARLGVLLPSQIVVRSAEPELTFVTSKVDCDAMLLIHREPKPNS
jgi:hypothetical protein